MAGETQRHEPWRRGCFGRADPLHGCRCCSLSHVICHGDHHSAEKGLDFLSFTPRIDCESFWENVFIPLPLFPFTAQCSEALNDPKSPDAWAAGAFMLIKADVLQDIGGIESIKSAILDDAELARVVKRSGHRVGYHLAPNLMHVRMFKSNSHAFWGPTKNAIALTFSHPWMSLPAMGLPVLFFWVPIAAALVGFWTNDVRLIAVGAFQPLADFMGSGPDQALLQVSLG